MVNKLVLLFTTIIILVVASLTVISYQMLQRESVNNSISSTSNNLLLVNRNLEAYLAGIKQLSLPQFDYDELNYAILHADKEYSSRMYVEDYLRSLYYSRDDLEGIYLYIVGSQTYYAVTKENYNVTVRTGTSDVVPNTSWYASAMQDPQNHAFQSLEDKTAAKEQTVYPANLNDSFMAYHRLMRSITTRKPQAVISFYFNSAVKDKILRDVPFDAGQHLLFLSPDNGLFHADDMDFYRRAIHVGLTDAIAANASGHFTWTEGDNKYLVVYDRGSDQGWTLAKPIPYREIYEAAMTNRNLGFAIGLGFLLLAILAVVIFSRKITKPLGTLHKQMSRFSAGDFEAEAPVYGRDEIAYLSHHFNLMVKRSNELINERYKMKLVEKSAILKALEAEINPHFLYNALQAISTKALKHERDDIAEMVDALALTFRYCISGKDIVSAKEELQHINRYMSLQKARFGNRLKVGYHWDEALMTYMLPKLSIQTLAENAIKHALEKVSATVTIAIAASLTVDHIEITVADDGPGFEPDRLRSVLQSFEAEWEDREGDSVGLVNLHTRLRLLYGEDARLEIHSDHTGTRMVMLIPRGGNEQHV
ncbi:HAMP domain-containing protein [Paenibacillus sp. NEAU-GSW1]|nr:sensor histidine kinase [Paenibacillus sp. NEAU-GSW1]MUT66964.1 HAMP domain-containing protein [Paenibacillus sp. NEAU-GSW1]